MRERGILMSGPMVRAILAGKKTQTRRAVKPQPEFGMEWAARGFDPPCALHLDKYGTPIGTHTCPYGAPGDRLWVRETWQQLGSSTDWETGYVDDVWAVKELNPKARCSYRADAGWEDTDSVEERGFGWRPAILMPRWASRITLAVESIRVERAQDISDADIEAEGVDAKAVEALWDAATKKRQTETQWACWGGAVPHSFALLSPMQRWAAAWTLINGRESWDANPWVWVVSFRRTP